MLRETGQEPISADYEKKEFGQVLRALRTRRGLTQEQVADRLGVRKSAVSRYETGQDGPTFDRLPILSELLGVSLSDMISMIETGNVEAGPDLVGTVPLISWVEAGHWRDVIDNLTPGQGTRISTTYRMKRHTYALRVKGDSMEPRFPEGSILIVEPEHPANPGSFVIVRQNHDSEVTFKQLVRDGGRYFLKPLNPRYPILELAPDAVICGVVRRVEMDV